MVQPREKRMVSEATLDVATETNLKNPVSKSTMQTKALISAAQAAAGPLGIIVLTDGQTIPAGTPAGTVVIWTNAPAAPGTDFKSTITATATVGITAAIPTNAAVGDVIVAMYANTSSESNQRVTSPGWVEIIDYAAIRPSRAAVYIYQVVDAAALTALGTTVALDAGGITSTVHAAHVFRVAGLNVTTAWNAYASGSNRASGTPATTSTAQLRPNTINTITAKYNAILAFFADADPEAAKLQNSAIDPGGTTGFTKLGESFAGPSDTGKYLYLSTWLKTVTANTTTAVPVGPTLNYTTPIVTTASPAAGQLILQAGTI